jgi:3-hydroxymyristoyl/3-hydroxydecanoyl-(acyl carrier protein) dehydratase
MIQKDILVQELVTPDHRSLIGHFPGNPVVPGTLILDRVCRAVETHFPKSALRGVRKVKFLKPLQVGLTFTIKLQTVSKGLNFTCNQQTNLIASGNLFLVFDE